MKDLWRSTDRSAWDEALERYDHVLRLQGVDGLAELDRWLRDELPGLLRARAPAHLTLDELVRVTRWKMSRGVWRGRNLALVRSNDPAAVVATSAAALERIPHPTAPVRELASLAGVGPATASAIVAAAAPEVYPFLDDVVAAVVPGLEDVKFTLKYYAGYADRLRARAAELGAGWTPASVERALWAHAGGKAGTRASG